MSYTSIYISLNCSHDGGRNIKANAEELRKINTFWSLGLLLSCKISREMRFPSTLILKEKGRKNYILKNDFSVTRARQL